MPELPTQTHHVEPPFLLGIDSTVSPTLDVRVKPGDLLSIPRYTIVRPLGRGGMGAVYEAVGALGVHVALKVIHPEKLSSTLLARFRQEAKAMMEMDHPNLARIYDYGESASGPYFTMKLLSGRTLADLLPSLKDDATAAIRLAIQIAGAVGFVHARRKVHRDLKPSNVLLGDDDQPFVADFGLVKEVGDELEGQEALAQTPERGQSSTLTHTGARLGTEAYMSPEQSAGQTSRIGPASDVWAIGVMLHEMVWGVRPTLDAAGQVAFLDSAAEPGVAADLRPIIARCLQHEPEQRYPTANELRQQLETLVWPKPILAVPTRRFGWLALAVVGFIGLVLGATYVAVADWQDAKLQIVSKAGDPLESLQNELADKGEVDLLRPDGQWRWHEWMTGDAVWNPDGSFATPPKQLRLLEIARGLPVSGYRLTMQVRHVGPGPEIGVYVGRSQQTSARGPCHCLMALAIRDHQGGVGPNGQPRMGRSVLARSCPLTDTQAFFDAPPIDEEHVEGTPGQWLDVEITLTDKAFTAKLGDKVYKTRSRNQLLHSARQLGFARTGFEALIPTFQTSDGLGLFCYDGAMEVRRAKLARFE